jgi:hypothetical protein
LFYVSTDARLLDVWNARHFHDDVAGLYSAWLASTQRGFAQALIIWNLESNTAEVPSMPFVLAITGKAEWVMAGECWWLGLVAVACPVILARASRIKVGCQEKCCQ